MRLRARTTKIWSAVTRHRFGRLADESAKLGRVQRPAAEVGRRLALDGDQSSAESQSGTPSGSEKW